MSKFPENSQYRVSVELSKRLKTLIEDNDCSSNQEFAELVEVSTPVISKAVNFGIVPSTKSLIKIADKLELSLKYLLGIENKNEFIPSTTPSNFSTRIAELTKEINMNYGRFASNTTFSRTYIYAWRREGTLPTIDYLFEIADYFKVSPDYLLGRTDYRK